MADTAAFCVDYLFPQVPARQYVLSLPYALRFKMAYSPDATTAERQSHFPMNDNYISPSDERGASR
jgi:hypothetical protein